MNVIRLNEVKEKGLAAASDRAVYDFAEKLTDGGISATVRRLMGADIEGACGQLRRKFLSETNLTDFSVKSSEKGEIWKEK